MNTKTRDWLISLFIVLIYFLGIMKIPYYLNKFFVGTEIAKNSVNILVLIKFLFVIILFIFLKRVNINSITVNVNKESFRNTILFGILLGIVLFVGDKLNDYVFKFLKYFIVDDITRIKIVISSNKIMFVYMVFIVPVVQELVYRNVVFGKLYDLYEGGEKYIRFLTPALLLGGLLFLVSGMYTLPVFIKHLFVSLVLCFGYYKTKRIETTILSNIIYNLGIVLFALFTKSPSIL